MSQRVTIHNLRALATVLNKLTGSPQTYFGSDESLPHRINVGHFHIDQAYGGYCLERTVNDAGGVTCPLTQGHIPARELYEQMRAYIAGIELGLSLRMIKEGA